MSPLRRIQRNIGNMSAMLQRAGINQVSFADAYLESSFAAAVRACLSCPNAELCGNWLGTEDRTIELAAFALLGSLTLIVFEIVDERRREHRKR